MMLDVGFGRVRRRLSSYITTPGGMSSSSGDMVQAAPTVSPDRASAMKKACETVAAQKMSASRAAKDAERAAARASLDKERAARRRQRASARDGADVRLPRVSRRSRILDTTSELSDVLAALPARFRGRDLQAAFSTVEDGVALSTLFQNIVGSDPVLLLVRDSGGARFGAYTSVPFSPGPHYAGSGEGFVFKLGPKGHVFPWSHANPFFQLVTPESLAVGGGGAFALYLDVLLEHGSSGESTTYANTCLASAEAFDVVVVEAYKLVVPTRFSLG